MNKVAEKMRSLGVADAADEIERLERLNVRRVRATVRLTAENASLREWVLELQPNTLERDALWFALRRLWDTANGNDECNKVDAIASFLARHSSLRDVQHKTGEPAA